MVRQIMILIIPSFWYPSLICFFFPSLSLFIYQSPEKGTVFLYLFTRTNTNDGEMTSEHGACGSVHACLPTVLTPHPHLKLFPDNICPPSQPSASLVCGPLGVPLLPLSLFQVLTSHHGPVDPGDGQRLKAEVPRTLLLLPGWATITSATQIYRTAADRLGRGPLDGPFVPLVGYF